MTTTTSSSIDALLIISSKCPHCPSVLGHLSDLVKAGEIAQLTIINIEQQPLAAQQYGVRSVPWLKIGSQQLQGLQTLATIKQNILWAKQKQSLSADFDFLLSNGQASKVTAQIIQQPSAVTTLLELLGNEGTVLSTRIGIGVVMENFATSAIELLQSIIPQLGKLTQHSNALIRSDACHYLGLSHHPSIQPLLEACLKDSDTDVREIAQDSLDELGNGL